MIYWEKASLNIWDLLIVHMQCNWQLRFTLILFSFFCNSFFVVALWNENKNKIWLDTNSDSLPLPPQAAHDFVIYRLGLIHFQVPFISILFHLIISL